MGEDQPRSEDLDSRNHFTQLLKLLGCQDLINAKQAHIEYRAYPTCYEAWVKCTDLIIFI